MSKKGEYLSEEQQENMYYDMLSEEFFLEQKRNKTDLEG